MREQASELHERLIQFYNNRTNDSRIVSTLCRLLYMVRSNLAHCGKTPYGPDLEKSTRDEAVGEVIYPLLSLCLNIPRKA